MERGGERGPSIAGGVVVVSKYYGRMVYNKTYRATQDLVRVVS